MRAGLTIAVLLFLSLSCGISQLPDSQKAKRDALRPQPPLSTAPTIYVSSILGDKMTHYVRPVYPAWVRIQQIQGEIEFRAIVGKDGRVQKLTFIKGLKSLTPYAEAAIRQWRYEPAKVNGIPLPFITDVILVINFRD